MTVSEIISKKINELGNKIIGTNGYSSVGAVLGAT